MKLDGAALHRVQTHGTHVARFVLSDALPQLCIYYGNMCMDNGTTVTWDGWNFFGDSLPSRNQERLDESRVTRIFPRNNRVECFFPFFLIYKPVAHDRVLRDFERFVPIAGHVRVYSSRLNFSSFVPAEFSETR